MADPPSEERDDYHHGDLERSLIRAGRSLVEEGGPDALTLRAAARRSGVSHAAPYRHFEDREALLAAVAEEGFAEFRDALTEAARAEHLPGDRVRAMGEAYVAFGRSRPGLFRLMFGPAVADKCRHPALQKQARAAYRVIEEGVARAVADNGTDPSVATMSVWALVHGLASLFLDGQGPPELDTEPEALTRAVTEWFATAVTERPGGNDQTEAS
ncbi:TetR/AcrR family transcriptional regulator [Thiohalorhabdus sp. Cl-TMA]|uniref:TetR/AcrR family transcriptional regulator n=1 Tax=Thiohalorhabdus methylotrophus TaxID=3242694 RepID=A0ABV4TTL9_9GAMM